MSNPRIDYVMSSERRPLAAPDGKPLIVHIVVNIEHWPFDKPMPRKILPGPHGIDKSPDVPNFSWVEYGLRCGFPRIVKALGDRNILATAAMNASIIDVYPQCAEAVLNAGWEFMGHGFFQRALQFETEEAEVLDRTLDHISSFTGTAVRGWLGPGLSESDDTPDLLKERNIDYVCDWVIDDLPTWMKTKHGPMIAMPYSFELNDSLIWPVEKQASDEQYKRFRQTLEVFDDELATGPRVLTLPLHPHCVGVPHRMYHFTRILDILMERSDTVFMTGAEIADWYMAAEPHDRSSS